MKKADAWVVLRLDGDAVNLSDYVAVKGIYDSEHAAQSAIPSSSIESRYLVLRSRHYIDDDSPVTLTKHLPDSIQGLSIHLSNGHTVINALHQEFNAIRDLWNRLPSKSRRPAILPLLSHLTECLIADALSASIIDDPHSAWDLELSDGTRIEVKTVLLDPDRKKSPNLQFRSDIAFDFFAVVIFRPDLTIEMARMIPVDALHIYARPVSHLANRSMLNLRVTQPLLDYPGSKQINLGSHSLYTG